MRVLRTFAALMAISVLLCSSSALRHTQQTRLLQYTPSRKLLQPADAGTDTTYLMVTHRIYAYTSDHFRNTDYGEILLEETAVSRTREHRTIIILTLSSNINHIKCPTEYPKHHIAIMLTTIEWKHEGPCSSMDMSDTAVSERIDTDVAPNTKSEREDVEQHAINLMLLCLILYILWLLYGYLEIRFKTHDIHEHLCNGRDLSGDSIYNNQPIATNDILETHVETELHSVVKFIDGIEPLADQTSYPNAQEPETQSRTSKRNKKKRSKAHTNGIQAHCIEIEGPIVPPGQFETLMRHLPSAASMEKEIIITARVLALLEKGITQRVYPHRNEELLSYYTATFRLAKKEDCHVLLTVLNRNLDLMRKGLEYHGARKLVTVDLNRIEDYHPPIEAHINNAFSYCSAHTNPAKMYTAALHTLETMTMLKREVFSLLALLKFLRQRDSKKKPLTLDLHNMPVQYAWTIAEQAILMLRAGESLMLVSGLGEDSRKRWYTKSGTIRGEIETNFDTFTKQHGNKYVNLKHPKCDRNNGTNRGCFEIWYRDM